MVVTICLLWSCRGLASLAEIEWVARYDGGFHDESENAVTDAQGNVYVTGTAHTRAAMKGVTEMQLASGIATVKYDPNGNQLWVRNFTPAQGRSARASGMVIDGQGNLIIGGTADQSNGQRAFATLKYTADGTLLWSEYYHGPGSGDDRISSLCVDGSGNIYVSGGATAANGKYDLAAVKYAPDGTQLWVSSYDGPAHGAEAVNSSTIDALGNYYVSGSSPGLQSGRDIVLVKFDPAGNQVWVRRYSGPGANDDEAVELDVDASGNLYAVGSVQVPGEGSDIITLKYDQNGILLWAKTYDGHANNDDNGYLLAVNPDGYVCVQGQSRNDNNTDSVTIKYAPDGTQLWVKRFEAATDQDNNFGYGVVLDAAGNVYTAHYSITQADGGDIVVIKYDPNGNELWLRRYDGPSHNEDTPGFYQPIVLDKDNNLIVTGPSHHGTDDDSLDYATFKIKQNDDGSGIEVAHDFDGDEGVDPNGSLLLASNGNLYGTTTYGGSNGNGTFYRIGPDGHHTVLYSFNGTIGLNPSHGRLVELGGQFYGTLEGDIFGQVPERKGGIYRMDPAGVLPKALHLFSGPDGSHPMAGLTLGADGNFYGVTLDGGANGGGVFFQITTTGLYTKKFDFDATVGTKPQSSLLLLGDGSFLCTCSEGGAQSAGTVVQLTTSGQCTKRHDFAYSDDTGASPQAGIFRGANGRYYGLCSFGGPNSGGAFFEFQLTGQTTVIYQFDPNTGYFPQSNPEVGSDGAFYGLVTSGGPDGVDGRGGIYRLTTSGEYSVLHYFADEFGTFFFPSTTPTESADGWLYVPVGSGGTDMNGFLFRLPIPVPPAGNVLADTVNDFAALQGTLNWYYGYYGTAGDPSTFIPIGFSSSDETWKNGGGLPFITQSSAQAGPDGTMQVVRRWQVSRTGKIRVAGNFGAPFAGGNGTLFRVLYDGTEEYSHIVTGSNQGDFSVDLDAVAGKYLDFVVDPLGDLNGDTLNYRATVTNIDSGDRGLRMGQLVTAAPAFAGTLTVTLNGAGGAGQWRLQGELSWRDSGAALSGLAAGDYLVEFQPVNGLAPDPELVHVDSGANSLSFDYPDTGDILDGGVTVHIKPDYVAGATNLAQKGQWRRQGETVYHSSGEIRVLAAGLHLIEFKGVAGRLSPLTASVLVYPGEVSDFTVTYFPQPAASGDRPAALTLDQATMQAPYAYCGQIQSDAGSGSGFAVADRVVLTAGHVVFDDSSLTFTSGLRWYFQRMAGEAEPTPMVPRGAYLLDGYATARRAAGVVPGESTVQSQQSDAGALYFDSTPSRGGFSGYLLSAPQHQWVGMAGQKTIIGYPVDLVDESVRGLMHATPLEPVDFTLAPTLGDTQSQVWRTRQIGGLPGMSGGPLFAEYDGGGIYPAGIFLGGNGEALVRAIDAQVAQMIQSAFVSASTGTNNTSGGLVQANARVSTSTFTLTSLTVNLTPSTGTAWRFVGPNGVVQMFRDSGTTATNIPLGKYTVQFTSKPGFATPPDMALSLDAAHGKSVSATYVALPKPVVSGAPLALASGGLPFNYAITASNNPASYSVTGDVPAWLTLSGNVLSGTPTETVAQGGAPADHMVQVQATSPSGTSDPFMLDIRIEPAGTLVLSVNDPNGGTISPSLPSPLQKPQGTRITLTAKPKKNYLFAGWIGAEPSTATKLSFALPQLASVTAKFVPNPFPPVAGNYAGLLDTPPVPDFARAGLASLTVGKTGSFTGTLLLGPTKYPLKGVFFPDGTYHGSTHVKTTSVALDLQIALSPALDRTITGKVMLGSTVTSLTANLCPVFTKAAPSPQTGLYTWILRHNANNPDVPQGDGYASIAVKYDGTLKLAGALGDGTKLSQAGRLVNAGTWPFYFPLYKSAGAFTGTIAYPLANDTMSLPPAVHWFHLPGAAGTPYAKGFTTPLTPLLGTWSPTSSVSLGQTNLNISQAGSDVPPPFPISVDSRNRVVPPAGSGFVLKVTPATGLFTGQFLNPTNRKPITFGGALLQSQNAGFGSYVGATKTAGFVEVSPQQ